MIIVPLIAAATKNYGLAKENLIIGTPSYFHSDNRCIFGDCALI